MDERTNWISRCLLADLKFGSVWLLQTPREFVEIRFTRTGLIRLGEVSRGQRPMAHYEPSTPGGEEAK